jgi:hypothetical protein
MEFKIIRTNAEDLTTANALKWQLLSKKKQLICLIYLGLGLLLLVCGIVSDRGLWNMLTTAGLVLLIMFGNILYHSAVSKQKFLAGVSEDALRHPEITVTISDGLFSYRNAAAYYEFKWTFFSHYKLHQDYLFIISGGNILSSFSIRSGELPPEDFAALCRFVAGILPEWK